MALPIIPLVRHENESEQNTFMYSPITAVEADMNITICVLSAC